MDPSQGTSNPAARYVPTEYALPSSYNCNDFTEFKDLLLLLRKNNDNFKFQLNKLNANTASQCEAVWRQLTDITTFRRNAILDCLSQSQAHVDSLSTLLNNNNNNTTTNNNNKSNNSFNSSNSNFSNVEREIRRVNQRMDLLRAEQDIEDILHRQAEKLFHRACPSYMFSSSSPSPSPSPSSS